MDLLSQLGTGFLVALAPENLFYCLAGVVIGTLVGVLPGIGPIAAMSLLLPATLAIPPTAAVIMLAGIYYGSMYGGSTTSILVRIPGEAASVVTCLDGHEMAKQGRAGPALAISAIGSFIAGTAALVGLVLLAPVMVTAALAFGPAEYCALMVLGLCLIAYLSQASVLKSLIMAAIGLVLGLAGLDSITGLPRLTFDRLELIDGVGLVPVVMGLFGVAEILKNLEQGTSRSLVQSKVTGLMPKRADWLASRFAILRGTVIGFVLGILPGGGAVISSFVAYAVEKRISKTPERFGHGAIEGVAAPEAANNAAAGSAFIPLLTLGIPPNAVLALLMGALIIHNVPIGPTLISQRPDLFWGVVASMYVGNVMLLILNLPLIGLWVRCLSVPYGILFPIILLLCCIGVFSVSGHIFDVYVMIAFGVVGWAVARFGFEPAPLVLGFVLGPLLENNLRKALILSRGSWMTFLERPISAVFIIASAVVLLTALVPWINAKRKEIAVEG
ncbi:tripartite tricarboxylate transporter permease [Phreatobacter stygius]|uniref:Tripartite tricarboxylate transporter permease n=1 Tax=Phreatobacter stygius TaxID=1940610 RepID=A0A4D7BFW0_9HYPH|nr:tripartite tricarboxylate transporter permease [Phreatobacter stygius]QCI68708.1 tripartite tricarboxylate transporter permease [Phreatobacter stygius]